MATAQQTVTRAYRDLGALDINSEPSAAEMTHGLELLSRMIAGWAAHGVNVQGASVSITADTTADSPLLTNVSATHSVIVGMGISGTGIYTDSQVREVRAFGESIVMSRPATADGTTIALTLTSIPLLERFEDGVICMLAVRLAPSVGVPASQDLRDMANEGWAALQAAYIQAPQADFDQALKSLSSNRYPSAF
jgi:hypothetical protein